MLFACVISLIFVGMFTAQLIWLLLPKRIEHRCVSGFAKIWLYRGRWRVRLNERHTYRPSTKMWFLWKEKHGCGKGMDRTSSYPNGLWVDCQVCRANPIADTARFDGHDESPWLERSQSVEPIYRSLGACLRKRTKPTRIACSPLN